MTDDSSAARLAREWQRHRHPGAAVVQHFIVNPSLVGFDDRSGDAQTQSAALTGGIVGRIAPEETVEDARLRFGRQHR